MRQVPVCLLLTFLLLTGFHGDAQQPKTIPGTAQEC
jgi:hypothetical protein